MRKWDEEILLIPTLISIYIYFKRRRLKNPIWYYYSYKLGTEPTDSYTSNFIFFF